MHPIPRLKVYSGPAVLSYGFRPFFLAGTVYAGLGLLIWLPLFFGAITIPTAFSPLDWHVHEMLYGYLTAVVTGFLLTAIPNWTGRLPLRGAALAVLVAVWIAGRIAVYVSADIGRPAAGVIDVSFLVLVAIAAAREVIAGRNWRNLPPIFILLVFFAGNVIFHIEDYQTGTAELGMRLGIAAAVALISLVGGRVVPSFTRNWLARENPGRLPVPFGRFDIAVTAVSLLALALWVGRPTGTVTAVLMLAAGAAQAARLGRWAGDRTLRNKLVLILHIGYVFVPLGFLMLGSAILLPDRMPTDAGIHAWTAGAIGTMTLAIMTRASLGHTGQPLAAGPLTQVVYSAVVLAALLRIAATFAGNTTIVLLQAAGAAWIVAFWLFAVGYGPLLLRRRKTAT
ncbi:MAG TPA: NnrS family protein [Xanthobacteraceae bacterium]|nr:NnrS family protein [Xanthobacteraceae bacterium]